MNKTTNYQLNQWERADRVLMEDFNADNAKLDAALAGKADKAALAELSQTVAGKAEVVFGTYTGDGDESRVVDLGFTPRAVYLCAKSGQAYDTINGTAHFAGGLFMPGFPLIRVNTNLPDQIAAEIVENGFRVRFYSGPNHSYTIDTNGSGMLFHYIAFR